MALIFLFSFSILLISLNLMLKNEFLTVIIPVRGGSKGIPRKNLYKFGKDTLLERTIKIAILCDFVDKVIVSTEDQEMYNIAKNYSVSSRKLRDRKLATDQAKTIDVVISELEVNKINNVTIITTSNVVVSIIGLSSQGNIGIVNIWGRIVPDQNANYSEVVPSQTPSWSEETASQTPSWSETSASQSPSWSEEEPSQNPNWTEEAA